MKTSIWKKVTIVVTGTCAAMAPAITAEILPLNGEWRFAFDPKSEGISQEWFKGTLADTIRLPGTTDEQQKGTRNTTPYEVRHLSRLYRYVGAAWYQRDVTIPQNWEGKRIALFLERSKPTSVWVDGQVMGDRDTLAAWHIYDLSAALGPGQHRLTILVDNGRGLPVNGGHQLSEDTQTNWNGVLGRIELRATDKVWMEDVWVYPIVSNRTARVRITLGNRAGQPVNGTIELSAASWNSSKAHVPPVISGKFEEAGDSTILEIDYDLGADTLLWDEFSPVLYKLALDLKAGPYTDHREVDFGMRDFRAQGTQFMVNGRKTFLRGKNDACVFPLTGYAPMDVESWLRVFKIARAYGINHYRFHSWCPPEAAFRAADQIGMYLQPELLNFGGDLSQNEQAAQYTLKEGWRVLQAFGNHPSFVMFALGNELGGGRQVRAGIVQKLRQWDPRRLYAQASNYDFGNPEFAAGDDYWTTFRTRRGETGAVRGSYAHVDAPLGHVQGGPPATTHDYVRAIADVPVPVIGHEVGQYQTFPNFREMDKYTGVLRPWNFEVFRKRLNAKGLSDQADDFMKASGRLAVICYREEIEAALRTPGFGGFQLLDLQDFPGQGTALVGILDAFMDSKRLVTPSAWREFCSPTVPLVLMAKRIWTTDEDFMAEVKVAHYGPSPIRQAEVTFRFTGVGGRELALGHFPAKDIAVGEVMEIGIIRLPLAKVTAPRKVSLVVRIGRTDYQNRYEFWVYPAKVDLTPPTQVTISRALDEKMQAVLRQGGRVLLLPELKNLTNSIEGFFANDFWCFPMFRRMKESPGTLGMLCDAKHPALARFPTEFHTNWQWWHILMNSQPVILDETPASYRPIVQIIDNVDEDRNHKLGLIFEGRVGEGRALVCTSDLLTLHDQPEARQLLLSLLTYAGSDRFNPDQDLPVSLLK